MFSVCDVPFNVGRGLAPAVALNKMRRMILRTVSGTGNTLSVGFADSSPRGRAKGCIQRIACSLGSPFGGAVTLVTERVFGPVPHHSKGVSQMATAGASPRPTVCCHLLELLRIHTAAAPLPSSKSVPKGRFGCHLPRRGRL